MPSPSDPVAIHFGGLSIRWYAIFILSGILIAIALVRWLARRRGMDPEFPLDAAPWVVLGAIVGARLYYVLLKWNFFVHHPSEAINIRLGGMTIHGAVAVGALMLWYACRRYGQRFLAWSDLVVAGLAIGQAIGRWGNWANQEAFGTPSTLPWAVQIQPDRRPEQYAQYATFHPTFLYESLFDLVNTLLLVWLVLRLPRSRRLREGDVAWIYFISYGVGRFLIERIRTDSLYIGPLPAAYWVSFGLIIIGSVMLILRHLVWPAPPGDQIVPAAAEDVAEAENGLHRPETEGAAGAR